jgi:CDP-paratose 2-epimerase
MRILITGICGYVGSRFAQRFAELLPGVEIVGIDNLSRRGSETNSGPLRKIGARVYHGDLRLASDVRVLPDADWVVDCAANPAVLSGLTAASGCSPQQLAEHNLVGTLNVLEYCRERHAGLVLLSSSRVYSIDALCRIPLRESATRFEVATPVSSDLRGFSAEGVAEDFSTAAPISLYGGTKLASEIMALEYASAFKFPLWINRCGVIGGPGQLGKIDQGIFSYWVYCCALNRPLRYIGFCGGGKQVRDCILAEDVADLVLKQIQAPDRHVPRVLNVGGGLAGAMSLLELTNRCEEHFGRKIAVSSSEESRPYDIAYYVTDIRRVKEAWGWQPTCTAPELVARLCHWTRENLALVRGLFE